MGGLREQRVEVGGRTVRYLTAGDGPPVVMLHALGENALDWTWAGAALSRERRVLAPDLPGIGDGRGELKDPSPTALTYFVGRFMDAVGAERAAVVGNSLGGLLALRLALSEPGRVGALCLVGSAGLGREISPALSLLAAPGLGEAAVAAAGTPFGARQRARGRAHLLFARGARSPRSWISEQVRLARTPGFLGSVLGALRAQISPAGQRDVLLERLGEVGAPTLVVWGSRDKVVPPRHAREAARRLKDGRLEEVPGCGHLPQVERPDRFAGVLGRFLGERDRP